MISDYVAAANVYNVTSRASDDKLCTRRVQRYNSREIAWQSGRPQSAAGGISTTSKLQFFAWPTTFDVDM